MSDVAKRYTASQSTKTLSDSDALLLLDHTVVPANLIDMRCLIEHGRKYWTMKWVGEDTVVTYQRANLLGDSPILILKDEENMEFFEHFYMKDDKHNRIAVWGSKKMEGMSFHARSVVNRMVEDMDDIFHGI